MPPCTVIPSWLAVALAPVGLKPALLGLLLFLVRFRELAPAPEVPARVAARITCASLLGRRAAVLCEGRQRKGKGHRCHHRLGEDVLFHTEPLRAWTVISASGRTTLSQSGRMRSSRIGVRVRDVESRRSKASD